MPCSWILNDIIRSNNQDYIYQPELGIKKAVHHPTVQLSLLVMTECVPLRFYLKSAVMLTLCISWTYLKI